MTPELREEIKGKVMDCIGDGIDAGDNDDLKSLKDCFEENCMEWAWWSSFIRW